MTIVNYFEINFNTLIIQVFFFTTNNSEFISSPLLGLMTRVCGAVRSEILTDFMRMLQKSEHPEKFRRNCLVAALKGYSRMVKNEENGLGPVNRQRGTRPTGKRRARGS